VGSGNSEPPIPEILRPFCIFWQGFFWVEVTGSPGGSIEVDKASALENPIEDGCRAYLRRGRTLPQSFIGLLVVKIIRPLPQVPIVHHMEEQRWQRPAA